MKTLLHLQLVISVLGGPHQRKVWVVIKIDIVDNFPQHNNPLCRQMIGSAYLAVPHQRETNNPHHSVILNHSNYFISRDLSNLFGHLNMWFDNCFLVISNGSEGLQSHHLQTPTPCLSNLFWLNRGLVFSFESSNLEVNKNFLSICIGISMIFKI